MEFFCPGLDASPDVVFLADHQVRALANTDIKCSDLRTLFSVPCNLPESDIIDIAVTAYVAGIKLGVSDPKAFNLHSDELVKTRIDNAMSKTPRVELLKRFNAFSEFYVCTHAHGLVMAMTSPTETELPRLKGAGEWTRVDEASFSMALFTALNLVYSFSAIHFNDRVSAPKDNSFSLNDVYRVMR